MTSSPTARGRSAAACRRCVGAANIGSRIDETWTAADALAYINRAGGGITSVNGHYDQYRAQPAAASGPLLNASAAAPAPGSLLFTIGCHAGLSSVDAYGVAGDPGLGDWSAQLTKGGSVFVGNTGFGYGDTGTVAYSERLLANFASQLATRASTAGQALMFAKQQYFATLGVAGVYDAKALQEATFYGLPMYRVVRDGRARRARAAAARPERRDGGLDGRLRRPSRAHRGHDGPRPLLDRRRPRPDRHPLPPDPAAHRSRRHARPTARSSTARSSRRSRRPT